MQFKFISYFLIRKTINLIHVLDFSLIFALTRKSSNIFFLFLSHAAKLLLVSKYVTKINKQMAANGKQIRSRKAMKRI